MPDLPVQRRPNPHRLALQRADAGGDRAANGPASWVVGLVGTQSERFRKVTLTADDLAAPHDPRRAALLRRRRTPPPARPPGLRPRHRLRVRSLLRALDLARRSAAASARSGLRLPAQARARAVPAGRRRRRGQDHHGGPAHPRAGAARPRRAHPDRLPGQPRLPVAARAEGEVRHEVPRPEGPGHPRPVRREPVAGAQPGHHLARPGEARRHPSRAAPGPLGSRHRGRGAPHVGRRRVAQEPALQAGRAAARHLGPHAPAHGDATQGRPAELQPVPAAPRRRRLRRREVDPRGDGPPAGALLPAPHQGGDGLLPRAAGGRHLGRRADLHQAHPAHGGLPDRRRGVRPLPRRDALREARERPRRGRGRGPARPRDRLPDVPLPAPARVEHLRHAAFAREPRAAPGRGSQARAGSRPPGAAGSPRSGRAGGDGGERARAAGGDARGDHARGERRPGAPGGPGAAAPRRPGPGGRGRGRGGQALGAQGRCSRRKASSTTRTSACSSSPSSRTRWTTSWSASSPGASASAASTAA